MSTSGTTYSTDPALYVFTSLTAGSSHIVTATSRLETILRANKVPFKAVDIAVDEKARMLWGRRAGKDPSGRMRKLPGLVQEGMILGDLVEIEDWNEYGEVKQNVKIYYDDHTIPPISQKPATPPPKRSAVLSPPAPPPATEKPKEAAKEESKTEGSGSVSTASKITMPIRSIADEAAQKAKDLRLQSLREKVHGKKNKDDGDDEADEARDGGDKEEERPELKRGSTQDSAITTSSASYSRRDSDSKPAGLQSPTTATWKTPSSTDNLREMLQSPTSTSWQPTHVDPPVRSLHGSFVEDASEEEIAAVERAETIKEDPSGEKEAEKREEEETKRRSLEVERKSA